MYDIRRDKGWELAGMAIYAICLDEKHVKVNSVEKGDQTVYKRQSRQRINEIIRQDRTGISPVRSCGLLGLQMLAAVQFQDG